jgi:23S rRNA pseudouridine955/2504/2580 synthase/23S rRNA pseudouridine1911/1915/1917 synthase
MIEGTIPPSGNKPTTQKNNWSIIVETDDFVAINKPAGMLSIPDREQSTPSLKDHLIQRYGSIFTVHRLDRDTSGIILFAKNDKSHQYLSTQFEGRQVEKFYSGLVTGKPTITDGSMHGAIAEHAVKKGLMVIHAKGKVAHTDYKVLELFNQFSLIEFQIHTGRTHQIRVHAKSIGHPLACDPLYGDGKPVLLSGIKKKFKLSKSVETETPLLNRVALHAFRINFTDRKGIVHQLEAPLPKDFMATLQQLRKNT